MFGLDLPPDLINLFNITLLFNKSFQLLLYIWYLPALRRQKETFLLLKCFYSRELDLISFQANVSLIQKQYIWFTWQIKGARMQIWKFPCQFVLIKKLYPENFTFSILRIFELFNPKVCQMFVYKHSERISNVKK